MIINTLNSWPWYLIFLLGLTIGFLLGIFSFDRKSHDGVIHITQGEENDKYLFEFNIPPEKIPRMKNVIFAVKIEQEQNLQSLK